VRVYPVRVSAAIDDISATSLDNWNGNNSRHPDFGPRQVPGDDPQPDPYVTSIIKQSHSHDYVSNYKALWGNYTSNSVGLPSQNFAPTAPVTSTATINQMVVPPAAPFSYGGCWTDSAARSLSHTAYTGNQNTTVQDCVGTCSRLGYTIAGIEFGEEVSSMCAFLYQLINIYLFTSAIVARNS
jgi:hypothetical protein